MSKDSFRCIIRIKFYYASDLFLVKSSKDQDFIEAVRQTIKPKLQIAQSQNESSTRVEKLDQLQKDENIDNSKSKTSLPPKKASSK